MDAVNETNELWRGLRELQRARRNQRRPERMRKLLALRMEGFSIEVISEYQVRVNRRLDIWLTHNRYHDIEKNVRGGFRDAQEFVREFFRGQGDTR